MPTYQYGYPGWPDPFGEMRRLQDELSRSPGRGEFPPANVYTNDKGCILVAEIPGMVKTDMEVTVHENSVTIKGRRVGSAKEGATYHRNERRSGAFARTVTLPFNVDAGKVEASYENGLLTVAMPRHEADMPRRIDIRTS